MPSVVHLNVRHSRGGAAQVARVLTAGASSRGWEARFFYGYGPRGGPALDQIPNAAQATTRLRAAGNLALHHLVGQDLIGLPVGSLADVESAVARSDVVHLHAVHSFWIKFEQLASLLRMRDSPVVWTMHDHWAVTGRCAQPNGCSRWKHGCGDCPNRRAYPPALIDRTRAQWQDKRALMNQIPHITFVSCAAWLADELRNHQPDWNVVHIPNGTDFNSLATPRHGIPHAVSNLIVVGVDLSDKDKHDHNLICELASLEGIRITTIGANSPFEGTTNVTNLGPASHAQIARAYREADALIYTSRIDYNPLTVLEALAAKLPVIAISTKATCEILQPLGIQTFERPADILQLAANQEDLEDVLRIIRDRLVSYAPRTHMDMIDDYYNLYQKIIDRK